MRFINVRQRRNQQRQTDFCQPAAEMNLNGVTDRRSILPDSGGRATLPSALLNCILPAITKEYDHFPLESGENHAGYQ